MSKILYVSYRTAPEASSQKRIIKTICDNLNPDNISASPSFVHSSDQVIYGISNPQKKLEKKDDSVLLGMLFQETESWSKPGTSYPDGNYAIFRSSKDTVEIACDNLGTRCVWYYFDEKLFN